MATIDGTTTRTEAPSLIAAGKVNGTDVYNRAGESLGEIYDVMIDKRSGKIAYAIMSFGGFLGMGDRYHPLPWSTLTYDTKLGGYVVDLNREQLEAAPSYDANDSPIWGDRGYENRIHDYYRATPYWGV